MEVNQWWADDPAETYWLETTDRADVGVDLKAPQADENGAEHWSYSLVTFVADGDIVFHYHITDSAIASWSRAVGGWWEEDIVWGSHAAGAQPAHRRPGFRRGLQGPFPLDRPLTLAGLRAAASELQRVREELRDHAGGSLYYPFELSEKRPPRATQFYLTKMPSALVAALPELRRVQTVAASTDVATAPVRPDAARESTQGEALGLPYRPANEAVATSVRNPWLIDPDVVDRGLRGHAITQNALAEHLRTLGLEPRSPRPDEPQFDLAWITRDAVCVAEVKTSH